MSNTHDMEPECCGDRPEEIEGDIESDAELDLGEIEEHRNEVHDSGYPAEFFTAVPGPTSVVWTKFPNGLISDVPDQVEMFMDGTFLFSLVESQL